MKWEYLVISLNKLVAIKENELNEAGRQGWELVCVSDGLAYLSRQVFDEDLTVRFAERRETVSCCVGEEGCNCIAECAC